MSIQSITATIDAFKNIDTPNSISPESLGNILQAIVNEIDNTQQDAAPMSNSDVINLWETVDDTGNIINGGIATSNYESI